MKNDASEHAEEDKKKKEEVETHNTAEQLIYQTEKQVNELGDKIEESDKKQIVDAVDDLKKSNGTSNIEEIKVSIDNLNNVWTKLSEKIYKDSQGTNPDSVNPEDLKNPNTENQSKTSDSDVEDADFEVVDDK